MDRRDHDDPRDDDEHALGSSDDRADDSARLATAAGSDEEHDDAADDDAADDDDDADDDDADDDAADDDDDADDDDADDDDADDDDADDDDARASAPPPAKRRSLGPTLLALGGGVWAIAAALRCGAPEPGPALSVSPDAAPTPGLSADPDAEPAIDRDPEARPDEDAADPSEDPDHETPEPAAAGADQPDLVDDDGPPPPEPLPEDWATNLDPPKQVTYTIRHGGSIKNVANLFKIFHHEITALNPGVSLEQELPPNSKVVVYVHEEGEPSESVGTASSGSLVGGVPMVEGPGRVLKMIPWKSWATAHTVSLLDQVLRRWGERGKGVQPVLVGNMAARKGGRLEPHSTHQSGRDVDIGYIQKLPAGEELNWREMSANNLDAAETWMLLKLLRSTGQIEVIFIDSSIQKLLYDHAAKHGTVPKNELSRWLEYPRSPPQRRALIQHVAGHVDHIHVRFKCQPHEKRCESRER